MLKLSSAHFTRTTNFFLEKCENRSLALKCLSLRYFFITFQICFSNEIKPETHADSVVGNFYVLLAWFLLVDLQPSKYILISNHFTTLIFVPRQRICLKEVSIQVRSSKKSSSFGRKECSVSLSVSVIFRFLIEFS